MSGVRDVKLDGVNIRLGEYCSKSIKYSILVGSYEADEAKTLGSILVPGDILMEFGTGVGYLAIKSARILGSENVYTYEANPGMIPIIQRHFEMNGVSPKLFNKMVGPTKGTQSFFVSQEFWSSSSVRRSPLDEEIQLDVVGIQDEVERLRPSVIVMDVEGAEVDLLPRLLGGPEILIVEFHPHITGQQRIDKAISTYLSNNSGMKVIAWSDQTVCIKNHSRNELQRLSELSTP